MDTSDVYPDVLGDALSYSFQRLAQLGSLVTAAATMEIRRRAQTNTATAARSQQEHRALQEQQRARWAPAHDPRWLAQADLLQAARVWSAATAYADADPAAASAARKCEERLRELHPYAMAWYDRLRSEGAGGFEAMRQAVPLFGRASHARPGDLAAERCVLEAPVRHDVAPRDGDAPDGGHSGPGSGPDRQLEQRGYQIVQELQARVVAERGYALSPDELATTLGATTTLPGDVIAMLARASDEERVAVDAEQARADDLDRISAVPSTPDDAMPSELLAAASQYKLDADTADTHASSDRTAAQLAAESFPCTAADAVMAATARTQARRSGTRTVTARRTRQPGRSV